MKAVTPFKQKSWKLFGFSLIFCYLCRHEEVLVDIGNDDAAFGDEG